MTQYIFVTGGVVSSLGKGLTSAAIGTLLESHGLKIAIQKFDPYINVDPGTMSPFQHGEVYVTRDGAETDLDLGHYERFTNADLSRHSNYTTGKVYSSVIQRERRGDYLGKTVQVIPHITDEIKDCISRIASSDIDIVISEIGGTVGDIESLPFLEALRQFGHEQGRDNVLFIHLTLLPYLKASGEIKTKPTQHSVGKLREIGILPDILVCRTEKDVEVEAQDKIALFCNVPRELVFIEKDVELSIYELPLLLRQQGMDQKILEHFGRPAGSGNIDRWIEVVDSLRSPRSEVEIAIVGKYIELTDSYKSIYEALTHGGIANNARVRFRRVQAEDLADGGAEIALGGVDGVLVPGGFGERGLEGKIAAIKYARESRTPFLGICYGMHAAVIEFAQNVLGIEEANSTEVCSDTSYPVIALLDEQEGISDKGGTMRLGAYPCTITLNSTSRKEYGLEKVDERHRHRYEFNNDYRDQFEAKGLKVTGTSPDGSLVEIVEVEDHPWFVACQFHPEFQSKPIDAHPLFKGLVGASLERKAHRE
ncbi:MAG TPA: CTP synthase [Planctomycetes bacterium]|nr:CTP synthase [Planctomycetota bacterium]HIN80576.1 CTP synthase [Planctomycetota bacterium]